MSRQQMCDHGYFTALGGSEARCPQSSHDRFLVFITQSQSLAQQRTNHAANEADNTTLQGVGDVVPQRGHLQLGSSQITRPLLLPRAPSVTPQIAQ